MKRNEFGFVLPNLYYQFLSEWDEVDPYEIGDSGICLYANEDLLERNETYQIEVDEPDILFDWSRGRFGLFYQEKCR